LLEELTALENVIHANKEDRTNKDISCNDEDNHNQLQWSKVSVKESHGLLRSTQELDFNIADFHFLDKVKQAYEKASCEVEKERVVEQVKEAIRPYTFTSNIVMDVLITSKQEECRLKSRFIVQEIEGQKATMKTKCKKRQCRCKFRIVMIRQEEQ
ncbi:hypothetical protein KI387_017155, partial [Taxus chinensis]